MKRVLFAAFAVTMLFGAAVQARAAEYTILHCALTKAYACTSEDGCNAVAIQYMNLPRFISIDFAAKVIKSLDKSVQREDTRFGSVDRIEGLTVIHGVEKRGWSLAIGDMSGAMTLSATGDGEGFTVFGSCITP